MANEFLSVQEIARQCLPILKENLSFPALCYRDYEASFSKKGDTVQVRKPPIYTALEFDGNIQPQDVEEGGVAVTLNKIADVSVTLGPKEMALNLESFTDQVLRPAVAAIAEKINADGMKMIFDAANELGEAGVAPGDMSIFAKAVKELNKNKAPFADRFAVWDPEAMSNLQLLEGVINAEKSGSTKALREGSIGRVLGVENFMSPSVPHKETAVSAVTLKAAAAKGDQKISVTLTGGKSLTEGDRIVIDGVGYCVAKGVQVSSSDETVTLELKQPLMGDVNSGSICEVTAVYTANLAFQKNAFAFVTRPLEPAIGVESYLVEYEGLPLRVTIGYDMNTKQQTMSVDILYGFVTLYPELACRVLG